MMPNFWHDSLPLLKSVRVLSWVSEVRTRGSPLGLAFRDSQRNIITFRTAGQRLSKKNQKLEMTVFDFVQMPQTYQSKLAKLVKCPNTSSLTIESGVQNSEALFSSSFHGLSSQTWEYSHFASPEQQDAAMVSGDETAAPSVLQTLRAGKEERTKISFQMFCIDS